jgi:periplasmic protein TonB
VAYSYSIDDPAKNSKRMAAFALVVIIHVLFVWVLASGLGKKVVEVVMGPVETRLIEELPDKEDEPPPPPPEIETPPPYVPPPEISIDIPMDSGPTTAISNVTSERPVAAPPPVAAKPVERQVVKTPPSTQGRGARITQPEYPPASRRAGEEGTVQLQVLVLESGRAGEVKVAKSSGFPKLDEAAINEVKRNWRFVPGKEDGKPVSMWHTFAVTFRLTD